jgi:hypothetical protein
LEKNAFYIEKAGFPKDFLTLFHEIARIQHTKISLGWRGLLFAGNSWAI